MATGMQKQKIAGVDTDPAVKSVKKLRAELKGLKDDLLNLEVGTEEYNKKMQRAAEISHTLQEQLEFISATAMDAGQIISNVTKSIGLFTGGLLAAKAVLNLFGIENEAVMKSLQKMQSLMAITQALPSIDAGAKAFKKLAISIGGAAKAAGAFKTALVTTGIGAVVALVATLATNWESVAKWLGITTAEQRKLNKELNDKALSDYADTLARRVRLEERLAAIMGASDSESLKAGLKVLEDEKTHLDEVKEALDNVTKAQNDYNDANKAQMASESWSSSSIENTNKAKVSLDNAIISLKNATQGLRDYSGNQDIVINNLEDLNKLYETNSKNILQTNKDIKEAEELEKKRAEAAKKEAANKERENRLKEEKKAAHELALSLMEVNEIANRALDPDQKLTNSKWEVPIAPVIVEEDEQALEDDIQKLADHIRQKLEPPTADELLNFVDQLQNAFKTPDEQYAEEQATLDEALERKLVSQEEYNKLSEKLAKEHADTQRQLAVQEAQTWINALGNMSSVFSSIADTINRDSEEGEKKYKALMTTSTIISMLAGVAGAISSAFMPVNSGMTIWGQIAMAASTSATVLASGIAQLVKINQTSSNGGTSTPATPSASSLSSLVAPVQYTSDVQGANIESAIKDSRVYVTEGDITNTLKRVSVTENEARY